MANGGKKCSIKESHQIFLVLDVFASHREGLIKEIATALHIDLLFIPPSMTAEPQPLDAEIFGQLKSAGSKLRVNKYLFDPSQSFIKEETSLSLQNCWKNLDSTKIRSEWKRVFDNANVLLHGFIPVPRKFEDV
jgi:hypothetical protein